MACLGFALRHEAILAGIEPEGLSIAKLTEQTIPEDWNEQRRLYGFPER